jgi:glycosyltransferase involved in cell wall biosynthesis
MNLSILHYHLMPGGVTRIISSQVASLTSCSYIEKVVILCGRFSPQFVTNGVTIIENVGMNYISPHEKKEFYMTLRDRLYSFMKDQIGRDDIIHIHNPNVGKNPVLTSAIYRLGAEGYKLFLHCHDFAEDRPDNIAFMKQVIQDVLSENVNEVMYPRFCHCFYGVLNSFDMERLKKIGIEKDKIQRIPNPVSFDMYTDVGQMEKARDDVCAHFHLNPQADIFIYPVRVIRRKNIGELILLAALFPGRACWLVSMAPHNPLEITFYRKWKAFVREKQLPVFFEAGKEIDFHTLMYGADRSITTSIKEGFGMSFLEPWLFQKPVVGRSIPYVINDFKEEGMIFDSLYNNLMVSWKGEKKDFPELSDHEQRQYITKLLHGKREREKTLAETRIDEVVFSPVSQQTIMHNKKIISETYSLEHYGKRLCTIYKKLSETGTSAST